MGPPAYVRPADTPRLNLRIPRGDETFDQLDRKRSSVGRFFSVLELRGKWSRRPDRRRFVYQVTGIAQAIAVHVRTWVDTRYAEPPRNADGLCAALTSLHAEEEAAA